MSPSTLASSGTPRTPGDDALLPFRTVLSGVEGRVARLGAVADEILSAHDAPEAVSRALGEALVLVAMLSAPLKPGGRLVLEVRSEGALRSLSVQLEAPGRLRGYASYDAERIASRAISGGAIIGSGYLALTVEPGSGEDRYQGVVALDGGTLTDAAIAYFHQSEQIPTFVRLAVAREFDSAAANGWRWRAGGIMLQDPDARSVSGDDPDGDRDSEGSDADAAESWRRVTMLAATVEDHELVDKRLTSERLLFRLFQEEGVRVRPEVGLSTFCRCSEERIAAFLAGIGRHERDALKDETGRITVRCEFCGRNYELTD